ncbi:porin [Paraburkholderia sp. J41]|uniref:porin n=1 Tax=Paraburkholderia sp. J41 TaxID=2805433 RepID=UPI002AC32D1A|nr:porin [Paraburkholderia sp. J41]
MRKILVYAAASATAIVVEVAQAQGSVTLYGIADAGFTYNNNQSGSKLYALTSGDLQGSRFGLRGLENLGSGLQALFVLENGFNILNGRLGQGNDVFGRQAYVGIASNRVGAVTLGRQYDSVVDYTGRFAVAYQWMPYEGAHPGDIDNMIDTNRVNNSIKYKSPEIAGFTFGGLYSLGGVAGDFSRNQIWSIGAGYHRGSLDLGAAYLTANDPNYSFFGNNSTSNTAASNMTSPVYSGYASAKTQQIVAVGGAYGIGNSTFGATYSNTQFKDIGALANLPAQGVEKGAAKFHNVEVNYKYQLTPALLLGVAYDFTKGYGANDAKYHQVMLGTDYFLSKRTDLYAAGIYQHASGTDSTGGAAVASITSLSPSTTSNQTAIILGIRHKF